MTTSQHWLVTLEIVQECEEDVAPEELSNLLSEHFEHFDYGEVTVTEIKSVHDRSIITVNVEKVENKNGLRFALLAILGADGFDSISMDWHYEAGMTNSLRKILNSLEKHFHCSIDVAY